MISRRPRNSLTDPVQAGWLLERAAKDLAVQHARQYGAPGTSAFMQLVIEHLEVTPDGTVRMEPIAPRSREEGLPIENG